MGKHTPGPWRIEDITSQGEHVYWRVACPTRSVAGISVDVPVYGTPNSKKVSEEIRANARLIAAAPEMLEALKALVEMADKKVTVKRAHEITSLARAAIAKAEGVK